MSAGEMLKRCPFCGGKASSNKETKVSTSGLAYKYKVVCSSCGASTEECNTEGLAIAKWEARVETVKE